MRSWPLFALLLAAPAAAADAPRQSWGKAGVSLDTYRTDAQICASRGWNAEVEDTEAVQVLRDGTSQIENLIGSTGTATDAATASAEPDPVVLNRQNQIARIVETARPARLFAEVRDVQMTTLERCLADRGYVRFQLTEAQAKRLGKLKRGSEARRGYLHALASDGDVLSAQPAQAAKAVSRR